VTIGSGVFEGAGVEFPTFPLTCVVVLKTLWHYRASVIQWLRRPITLQWLKMSLYCLQNIVLHFRPQMTHVAARFLCDS